MTTTERQNRYRAKRRIEGDKRLSVWIKKDVADALSDATRYLGVTQEHLINNILLSLTKTLPKESWPTTQSQDQP